MEGQSGDAWVAEMICVDVLWNLYVILWTELRPDSLNFDVQIGNRLYSYLKIMEFESINKQLLIKGQKDPR